MLQKHDATGARNASSEHASQGASLLYTLVVHTRNRYSLKQLITVKTSLFHWLSSMMVNVLGRLEAAISQSDKICLVTLFSVRLNPLRIFRKNLHTSLRPAGWKIF